MELIEREAGGPRPGRIRMKVNSLVDQPVIDALYRASAASVAIDLVVRGMCCLRPGVAGLSENVRVRSVVGRFLEHSRIFAFGDEASGPVRYLIGSADLMRRNLERRIEAVVPVEAPELQERLREVLDLALADDVLAWELGADGRWAKVPTADGLCCQAELHRRALARALPRPDPGESR